MKPIRLILTDPADKLAAGTSRFWGNPDLPDAEAYPMYTDDVGDLYPYFFICQINLRELALFAPDNPLPKQGLLLFFAKIDHYLGYPADSDSIGGSISDADDVKILYFRDINGFNEVVMLDEDDNPANPDELEISFSYKAEPYSDEHELFAMPTHREWETWDSPYEDLIILLQIDSFSGNDFDLNFMDCGVLDFLISPEALKAHNFNDVRGIVLST